MGRLARLNPRSPEYAMELADTTLDVKGRPLHEGDEVLVIVPGPTVFTITRIAPVLDANAPANLLAITIQAAAKFIAPRGQPNAEFLRVATAEEVREMKAKKVAEAADEARRASGMGQP